MYATNRQVFLNVFNAYTTQGRDGLSRYDKDLLTTALKHGQQVKVNVSDNPVLDSFLSRLEGLTQ